MAYELLSECEAGQIAKTSSRNPGNVARACSGGKSFVSMATEAYYARDRGLNRMFRLRSSVVFAFCLLLALKTPVHAAQDKPNKGGGEDKTLFLVARPELGDPLFKESVVLIFPSSVVAVKGLVVGLIVNRPARIALSKIFPEDDALKARSETAYFGGPVDPTAPGVVFRSSQAVKHAVLLFGDVYVSFDPDLIKELLKKPEERPDSRLFVGRSQWASAQLQNEMAMRAWYSVRAETNLIFSASPQSLWRKLFEREEPPDVAKVSDVPFDLSAILTVGVRQAKDRPGSAREIFP